MKRNVLSPGVPSLIRRVVILGFSLALILVSSVLFANEESHSEEAEQHDSKPTDKQSGKEKTADKQASEKQAHESTALDEHLPPSDLNDPKQLLQLLREQVDQLPIETLKALTDQVLLKTSPASAEGHEAIKLFRQALLSSARHSAELNNHSEAILNYERWRSYALQQDEFDPNMATVLIEIGREYRNVGSSLTAIETFYRAMTYGRQSAADSSVLRMARWEVAETTYLMKNWERARRLYEIFLDADEQKDILTETAYYRVGDCWRAQGDENQMILSYQQALSNNGNHRYAPEARMALLESFLDRENLPAWTRTLKEFADSVAFMQPADAVYWKKRSGELLYALLFKSHNFEKALLVLQALEKMDSQDEAWLQQIARWKGLVYIQKGEWENAKNILAAKQVSQPAAATPPSGSPETKPPVQLEALIPNAEYKDLCEWIERSEKRKSDLGLPTKPLTP